MAYIGKEPIVGNFQKCDAISVVNGQAAYTLQVSSTNVVPESANHMLVSLNVILQAPVTSFSVSGSTLTFVSNLATGDVIDFVILLGNVLDIGTPSDATVTNAKLAQDIISGETELAVAPADTDEFLVSDAGTLKRIDYSLIKASSTPYFYGEVASTTTITRSTATKVTGCTNNEVDSDSAFDGTTFTVPSGEGGKYYIELTVTGNFASIGQDGEEIRALLYKNGSSIKTARWRNSSASGQTIRRAAVIVSAILDLSATDTIELYAFLTDADSGNADYLSGETSMAGYKLIG
jgi:hypothetical protein